MGFHGDFRSLSGPWSRGKEQRADEGEDAFVRIRESDETALSRRNERFLVVPLFSAAFVFVETW